MPAPKQATSSVIVIRSRKTVALPPATLGFAHFVDPDLYDPDKPMFKGNFHYNPPGLAALAPQIQVNCIDAHLEDLHEEMRKVMSEGDAKKFIAKQPTSVEEFIESKLKEAKEGAKIQLPHLTLATKATYIDKKTKEVKQKSFTVWDKNNKLLDLPKLRLGLGSIVEPIVNCNLYFSKVNATNPTPSMQLAGVRVLKLVQFGGQSNAPTSADDDSIREVMGDDFEFGDDDLLAFAAGGASAGVAPEAPEPSDEPEF